MANKKWTIIVYMAGDNNLAEEMVGALQQMNRSSLYADLSLVVLFDSGGPLKKFSRTFTRSQPPRPVISAGTSFSSLYGASGKPKHPKLELDDVEFFQRVKLPPGPVASGGAAPKPRFRKVKLKGIRGILKAFIRETIIAEVKEKKQANHYMLVLSGHGSGAVGDFLGGNRRAFTEFTIRDVGVVLEKVSSDFDEGGSYAGQGGSYKGIDILGLDSCLMSMTEVAYEVRRSADYLVGAQGFEPDTGWPYKSILELFERLAKPNTPALLAPENVAKEIVRTYIDDYIDYRHADTSTDQAALKLSRIFDLKNALNELASLLEKQIQDVLIKDAILLAHWEAQGYKFEQYVDLWDFCNRLNLQCQKITPRPKKIQDACLAVQDAIDGKKRIIDDYKGVVTRSCYAGAAFQHSHGVSVFFPWANLEDAAGTSDVKHYSQLGFAAATRWNEFLTAYLERTQRLVRDGDGETKPDAKDLQDSRLNRRAGLFTGKPGKFDPDSNGRFDPDSDGRFDPDSDGRFDPDSDGRVGRGTKIASMKNPPVRWRLRECDD